MNRKILFLVNPVSGGGRNLRKIQSVEAYFTRKKIPHRIVLTGEPGQASVLAARAREEGFDTVVAAGGDGTIREVIASLRGTDLTLGVLPWGTGNVFAREMGIPRSLRAQCRLIRKGRSRILDTGEAGDSPFLLMASAGLDSYALSKMGDPFWKRILGLGSYLRGGLRALSRYRFPLIQVESEEGRKDSGTFVLVGNTRLYGAFFRFHPAADPCDGVLDVFVFRERGLSPLLMLLLRLVITTLFPGYRRWWNLFLRRQGVWQTRKVKLSSETAVRLQVDGDGDGFLPRTLEVKPGSLRVLLP